MKKIIHIIIGIFLFTLSFPLTIIASNTHEEINPGIRVEGMEEDDGTMWWQYAYWDTTGEFPSSIGYIEYIEETDKFEVGLVENTSENQQEIKDAVPNSQNQLIFSGATYSREHQKEFREDFTNKYLTEDSYEIDSISWEKDALAIYVDPENIEEYKNYFESTYPGKVVVHPEEFSQEPVDWVGYYLSLLPSEPPYGSEEYVIHHFGEDDGTMEWRYQLWSVTENFPDNLGFIQLKDDQVTWEIGLVENTSETQQELLASVPNSIDDIEFMDASYALNRLTEVQDEIIQEYLTNNEHSQIYALGIMNNRIMISVDEEVYEDYTNQFNEKYGEIVQVEIGDPNETLEETFVDENFQSDGPVGTSWRTMLLLGGIVIVVVIIVWQRNQSTSKKQTNTGQTIDEPSTISRSEIKEMIKATNYEPSKDLYQSIINKMKETDMNSTDKKQS